MLLISCRR